MKTGIYHKYNVMLYRTLRMLYNVYPNRLCTREIAEEFGVNPTHITDRMKDYVRYGYITRTKTRYPDPVTGRKVRLLRLSKFGARVYIDLVNRIQHGFDLNRSSSRPDRLDMYFGVAPKTLRAISSEEREEFLQEKMKLVSELNDIVKKASLMGLAAKGNSNEEEDVYEEYDDGANLIGEQDLELPVIDNEQRQFSSVMAKPIAKLDE